MYRLAVALVWSAFRAHNIHGNLQADGAINALMVLIALAVVVKDAHFVAKEASTVGSRLSY